MSAVLSCTQMRISAGISVPNSANYGARLANRRDR